MSQWAPESKNWPQTPPKPAPLESGEKNLDTSVQSGEDHNDLRVPENSVSSSVRAEGPLDSDSANKAGAERKIPWGIQLAPFFLSSVFFMSGVFAFMAPFPLLALHFRKGRKWSWGGVLTNSLLVGLLGGSLSAVFYLIFVAVVVLVLPEVLNRKVSLEKSVGLTLAGMLGAMAGFAFGYSLLNQVDLITLFSTQVTQFVNTLIQSLPNQSGMVSSAELEEWKSNLIVELPCLLAISCLVIVCSNLILVLRANPGGVRERLGMDLAVLKKWKASEYLVWPTIASGVFLLFDAGVASDVAINCFKFLMAVYALQGLSILSYLFDVWGVKGVFRLVGFSLSIFVMLPLILSLGFFDLWFDFRSKFRQA